MTKRFYFTIFAAFLIFAVSIAFTAIYSTPPVSPAYSPASRTFDKFSDPEEETRLKQGPTGNAGISNPLAGPAANVPSHVPQPPYAPGGSARSDVLPKTDLPVPPTFTNPLIGNNSGGSGSK